MPQPPIRQFARLCLAAAQGDDGVMTRECAKITDQAALDGVIARAQAHRVGPLLAAVLQRHAQSSGLKIPADGPLGTPVQNLSRAMMMKGQLAQLDTALAGSGTRALLIKGGVQLFATAYPAPGMRHMADLDVLIDDPAVLKAMTALGYHHKDGQPLPRDIALPHGEYHLPPALRDSDIVAVEPHILPCAPMFAHLIPGDLFELALPLPRCQSLCQTSPMQHLAIQLVHLLCHDRDTLDGGLLLRGLVECELLLHQLSADDQTKLRQHFADQGTGGLWQAWRALADWVFHGDARAMWRSPRAALLVAEFRLRATGDGAMIAIALTNRVLRTLQPKYWRSGAARRHGLRLGQTAFWTRLYSKFRAALTG